MLTTAGKSALVRKVNLVQVSLFKALTSNGLPLPCSAFSLLERIIPANIQMWKVIPVLMSDIQPKSRDDSSIFQTPSYLRHLVLGADRTEALHQSLECCLHFSLLHCRYAGKQS